MSQVSENVPVMTQMVYDTMSAATGVASASAFTALAFCSAS
jgi:hypothetical protein